MDELVQPELPSVQPRVRGPGRRPGRDENVSEVAQQRGRVFRTCPAGVSALIPVVSWPLSKDFVGERRDGSRNSRCLLVLLCPLSFGGSILSSPADCRPVSPRLPLREGQGGAGQQLPTVAFPLPSQVEMQ